MSAAEYFAPEPQNPSEQEKSRKEKRNRRLKQAGVTAVVLTGVVGSAAMLQTHENEQKSQKTVEISTGEYNAIDATLVAQAEKLLSTMGSGQDYLVSKENAKLSSTLGAVDMYETSSDLTDGSLTSRFVSESEDLKYYSNIGFVIRQTPEGVVLDVSEDSSIETSGTPGATTYDMLFNNPDFDLLDYEDEATLSIPVTEELVAAYLSNEATDATALTAGLLNGVAIETDDRRITTHFTKEKDGVTITNQAGLVHTAPFMGDFTSTPKSVLDKQLEVIK